jgi:hypothetical protein
MRRIVLAGLAVVAAASVFDVPAAQAQVSSGRNPWCLRDGPGMGRGSWDCAYQSFQQCEASRFGAGGTCTQNPNYRGGRQTRSPRRDNWDGGRGGGTWGFGGSRW